MLERHPGLQIVSVESGAGWIPFILEALDYEMAENAPRQIAELSHDALGVLPPPDLRHHLVREAATSRSSSTPSVPTTCSSRPTSPTRRACTPTRWRRPTTTWPRSPPDARRKILGDNAAGLYRL